RAPGLLGPVTTGRTKARRLSHAVSTTAGFPEYHRPRAGQGPRSPTDQSACTSIFSVSSASLIGMNRLLPATPAALPREVGPSPAPPRPSGGPRLLPGRIFTSLGSQRCCSTVRTPLSTPRVTDEAKVSPSGEPIA